MRHVNILIITIFLLNIANISYSQISKGGKPLSLKKELNNCDKIPVIEMPSFDVAKQINDSKKLYENNKFLYFAKSFDVTIDIKKEGLIEKIDSLGTIWTLAIKSKDAYSLNLLFSKYTMPQGGELFIYSADKYHIIGAFTNDNNNLNLSLATSPVKGDNIVIELFEPDNVEFSSEIIIGSVNHDYLNIFKLLKDGQFGASGGCNIDINCIEGNNWQNEKQSVCRMIISGNGLCSGALINNTNNDGTPYFLTANHCYSSYSNYVSAVNNTVFYFNYESQTCGGGDGSTAQTISGATLRSNSASSDFCLVQLSSTPQFTYNPYYSGWFRNNNSATSATGIHHPVGDVKKICVENNALSSTSYLSNTVDNNSDHWRVADWDAGVTEGGSSGSPLYNQNHRIVGQLHGGGAGCSGSNDNGDPDWYGKFSSSWTGGGTNATRLQNWLDPSNTTTELAGLRLIRNTTINAKTPASGDIVRLENVSVQGGENVVININERFEAIGTFNAPVGATLEIRP